MIQQLLLPRVRSQKHFVILFEPKKKSFKKSVQPAVLECWQVRLELLLNWHVKRFAFDAKFKADCFTVGVSGKNWSENNGPFIRGEICSRVNTMVIRLNRCHRHRRLYLTDSCLSQNVIVLRPIEHLRMWKKQLHDVFKVAVFSSSIKARPTFAGTLHWLTTDGIRNMLTISGDQTFRRLRLRRGKGGGRGEKEITIKSYLWLSQWYRTPFACGRPRWLPF